MDYKKPLNTILSKDMDRKEFLVHAGAVTLALAGISGIIRSLTDLNGHKQTKGYGASSYGGRTTSQSTSTKPNKLVRLG